MADLQDYMQAVADTEWARHFRNFHEPTTVFQWTIDGDVDYEKFDEWAQSSGAVRRYTVGAIERGSFGRGHRDVAIQLWQPCSAMSLHRCFGGHFRAHLPTEWEFTEEYATKWGTELEWQSSRQWGNEPRAGDFQRHYETVRENSRWGRDDVDTGVGAGQQSRRPNME